MTAIQNEEQPRWRRDLERFLPLKPQFVLSGNVRDLQIAHVHGELTPLPMAAALERCLREAGCAAVLGYDPIDGFRATGWSPADREADLAAMAAVGLAPTDGVAAAGPELLRQTMQQIVEDGGRRIALIIDFAARLTTRPDALSADEHRLFASAYILSQNAEPRAAADGAAFFNTIIWIVEKETDLPDWLMIGNPALRHIAVGPPDRSVRRSIAPALLRSMPGGAAMDATDEAAALTDFVDQTSGMLLHDLAAIAELARMEDVAAQDVGEAVRRYKVGVTEDPWARLDRGRIGEGEAFIRRRVKGQAHAATHMLDIVKRAVTGVGGAGRSGRPRGVVFLAGPTGVGKTELAKTVTELLFGDESAYVRFDMSEFSAEHADQRLLGAPPGYVGYDVGGELTNAVRERPFSVILFDEIEKAHPRILDKFLQILDDGVLTSGRGERVYFSEALIVFTSNLGIYQLDPQTGGRTANVSPDDDFGAVERKVRQEIENHFKLVLNRPEILNRIGENIVVFDFIRPAVAHEIFDSMLANVLEDIAAGGIEIELADAARDALKAACVADLSNGGRGVRNQVEAQFINPLARALFDAGAQSGDRFRVDAILRDPTPAVTLTAPDGDGVP